MATKKRTVKKGSRPAPKKKSSKIKSFINVPAVASEAERVKDILRSVSVTAKQTAKAIAEFHDAKGKVINGTSQERPEGSHPGKQLANTALSVGHYEHPKPLAEYHAKVIPVNRKYSQRISIPKGESALIFKPGHRINKEVVQILVDTSSLPNAALDIQPIRRDPDSLAESVRIQLHDYSIAEQNTFLVTLLGKIKRARTVRVKNAENNNRVSQDEEQSARENLDSLELILNGNFERMKLSGK